MAVLQNGSLTVGVPTTEVRQLTRLLAHQATVRSVSYEVDLGAASLAMLRRRAGFDMMPKCAITPTVSALLAI